MFSSEQILIIFDGDQLSIFGIDTFAVKLKKS